MTNQKPLPPEDEKFVAWLMLIRNYLPKKMTIDEAKKLYERKCHDDLL